MDPIHGSDPWVRFMDLIHGNDGVKNQTLTTKWGGNRNCEVSIGGTEQKTEIFHCYNGSGGSSRVGEGLYGEKQW